MPSDAEARALLAARDEYLRWHVAEVVYPAPAKVTGTQWLALRRALERIRALLWLGEPTIEPNGFGRRFAPRWEYEARVEDLVDMLREGEATAPQPTSSALATLRRALADICMGDSQEFNLRIGAACESFHLAPASDSLTEIDSITGVLLAVARMMAPARGRRNASDGAYELLWRCADNWVHAFGPIGIGEETRFARVLLCLQGDARDRWGWRRSVVIDGYELVAPEITCDVIRRMSERLRGRSAFELGESNWRDAMARAGMHHDLLAANAPP